MKKTFFQRVRHRLFRMRLHPIRVFVFHQVSDLFEPETMWECDWTQTEDFKQMILALKRKYTFISLPEVQQHLSKDWFRFRNYAALTADDGWASLTNILPWLAEKKIPVTLFLNPSCLDGLHWNSRRTDKLLTQDDVFQCVEDNAPFVTIASHGWTHQSCTEMNMDEFEESVLKSENVLKVLPGKLPFFAFPSGLYTVAHVGFLRENGLVPVFVDGTENESDPCSIHRYCIDGDGGKRFIR